MSFLDRFKPQPRWKHADAAVRAAAVAEIPDDEESLATLRELASGDEDVRVRRAAADGCDSAADILPLARSERDEDLRRELIERLVSIATAPDDADGDAALALEGIEDQRQLADRGAGLAVRYGAHRGARARARRQGARQHRAQGRASGDGARSGAANRRSRRAAERRGEDGSQGRRCRGAGARGRVERSGASFAKRSIWWRHGRRTNRWQRGRGQ